MRKEEVQQLITEQDQIIGADKKFQVYANMPAENPRGMGINLMLRSDMFGLQTTLDDDTNQKLTTRNALAAKEKLSKEKRVRDFGNEPEDEEQYLTRLNTELEKLGFNLATDDPDYLEFLRQKYHTKPGMID